MRRFALVSALLCVSAPGLFAQGYQLQEIADHNYVNRHPQISDTGTVVWQAHGIGEPDEEGGGTEIFVHFNGETKAITLDKFHKRAAHQKPSVQGNAVLWQTTRNRYTKAQAQTWVLREVPDALRDQPYKEQYAFYVNANKLTATGGTGDFNLQPKMQTFAGPVSNYAQYATAYAQPDRIKATNVNIFGQAEKVADPNDPNDPDDPDGADFTEAALLAKIEQGEIISEADHPAQLKARRRTLCFNELCKWTPEEDVSWLTYDTRNDLGPSWDGELVAWQKAKSFPFGWEIMALDGETRHQLTTNYYYDMAAKVHNRHVTWYGWDGNDYEIYLWNADTKVTTQITSNKYNDVAPVIWNDQLAWEGYPTHDPDIFFYKDGVVTKISYNNSDSRPVIWDGRVAWEGFDGDDEEIYFFDGKETQAITDNDFIDREPHFRDGLVTWMHYHDGFDAEIMVWDERNKQTKRLTDNEIEDRNPQTAGGRVVWEANNFEKSEIWVATPSP